MVLKQGYAKQAKVFSEAWIGKWKECAGHKGLRV